MRSTLVHRRRSARTGFDAAPVRHDDGRLRGTPLAGRRVREQAGDGPRRDEHVVRRVSRHPPESGHAQPGQHAHDRAARVCAPYANTSMRVTDADVQRVARDRRRSPPRRASALRPRCRSRARRRRTRGRRAKSVSSSCDGRRHGATRAAASRSTRWRPSAGACRRRSDRGSRRAARSSCGRPRGRSTETISSTGRAGVRARAGSTTLNVSPTTNEPVMIAVPSSEPSTMSTVSRGRRARCAARAGAAPAAG